MKKINIAWCTVFLLCENQAFGAEAGMPQLNPEFWAAQIFWLILIFAGLYLTIWKIFLPKITYSIESRKSKMVSDLSEAQKLKENAEKKLKEYEKIIEDAKKEAKKIIQDSNKVLELDLEKKKKEFSNEVEKEILIAEKEIVNLRKSSVQNINKIATEISEEIIKQIIDSEVNKSNVAAIVNDVSKKELEKSL